MSKRRGANFREHNPRTRPLGRDAHQSLRTLRNDVRGNERRGDAEVAGGDDATIGSSLRCDIDERGALQAHQGSLRQT